jgi:hypothetical protein
MNQGEDPLSLKEIKELLKQMEAEGLVAQDPPGSDKWMVTKAGQDFADREGEEAGQYD